MSSNWHTEVFAQKNLFEIWRAIRRIPRTGFNRTIFWSAVTFFGVYSGWVLSTKDQAYSNELVSVIHQWADAAISLTIGILGFLVAGFAIFASITNADLFIAVAQKRDEESGLNKLQKIFFPFMDVFINYLGLLTLGLIIKLGYAPGAPLQQIGAAILAKWPVVGLPFNLSAQAFLGVWIVVALLRLKSFLFNLYQSVLLTITTEDVRRQSLRTAKRSDQDSV